MYKIKLGSGDESVFNSIEELSFGIGTGIIGPDAQIFHDRAEKWLPVTMHPAYKEATAAAPPPDPTSGNGRNGHPHTSPGSESGHAQTLVDEGGMDLLTLLNLEELVEFDPRNVQDSAATQDSAESLPEAADPEPEAEFEQESPKPEEDDESWSPASVEVLEALDEEEPEAAEPVASLINSDLELLKSEFDSVEQDTVAESTLDFEDELDRRDDDEPETSQPSEVLDDSTTVDNSATQALDSKIDELSVAASDDGEPVSETDEAQVEGGTRDADDESVDEFVDDLHDEDGAIESVADDVAESQIEDIEDEEDTTEDVEEVADAPEMEAAEFEEHEDDWEEEVAEPESDPVVDEVEGEDLSTVDADEADEIEAGVEAVQEEAFEEEYAEGTPVPAGARVAEEYDPIAAFEPDLDDLTTDSLSTISGRLPGANKKLLIAVAVAAGLVVMAGLVWLLKGPAAGGNGDNPAAGSVTPVAAATIVPQVPSIAAATVTDSSAPLAADLQQEYEESYARAQVRFDDALRRAGFVRLFVPSRFSSAEEMVAVRSAVRNAQRALSDYALREGTIEDGYANPDPSLSETRANRELAEDLLAATDRLFGLLLDNLDAHAVRAGAITITDNAVEAEYARLLDEVDRLVILASIVEGGTTSASVSRIAAGIGTTRPLPLSTLAPAPALPENLAPVVAQP
jgi:hypothetical protein